MHSVVHFEVHATDPEKLADFYRNVFGWQIEKYEGIPGLEYWGVITAEKDAPNAVNGGLVRRQGPAPAAGTPVSAFVCTLRVDDLDGLIERAQAHGAKIATPKFALSGMAWQAYLLDPDHNLFGLHQPDPNAK